MDLGRSCGAVRDSQELKEEFCQVSTSGEVSGADGWVWLERAFAYVDQFPGDCSWEEAEFELWSLRSHFEEVHEKFGGYDSSWAHSFRTLRKAVERLANRFE